MWLRPLIYSLHHIKSAILYLKKSHKECNSKDWISTAWLIKWSDLNYIPKLIAYGKRMRAWKFSHATAKLSEKM